MGFFRDAINSYKERRDKEPGELPSLNTTQEVAQSTTPSNVPVAELKGPSLSEIIAKETKDKPVLQSRETPTTTEQLAQFEGQTISQAGEDAARPSGRDLPLVGGPLFGKETGFLYPQGTVARMVEEQGVVGFFIEGFKDRQNPTDEVVGRRIDDRYQNLIEQGITPDRALDAAVQDFLESTPGTASNVKDLRKPGVTLTDEEESALFTVNLMEDVFATLDAPVFVGSAKLTKPGIEALEPVIENAKDIILSRLKAPVQVERTGTRQPDILGDSQEKEQYIEFLQDIKDPSINDLSQGLELLRLEGKQIDDIQDGLNTALTDIKAEPGKYLRDPKTGQFQGSTPAREPFTVEGETTSRFLNELEGKTSVKRQFVEDFMNRGDVRQAEKDILREILEETDGAKIDAKEFGEKVQGKLLPLESQNRVTRGDGSSINIGDYENVSLPDELRGDIDQYYENVYSSPIKNSAGSVHNFDRYTDSYFAHTRIEDMADGQTRRVIEAQSDLFQKGRLENEMLPPSTAQDSVRKAFFEADQARQAELSQLQRYRNTWWERIIREEVRQASQDGKTKLQFPTGETAMKIEGLGDDASWQVGTREATKDDLIVGEQITRNNTERWRITEVGEDGNFKAVPRDKYDQAIRDAKTLPGTQGKDIGYDEAVNLLEKEGLQVDRAASESFNISGKFDTNNPIYKFYEKDVAKYLKKVYGAEKVTDERGVTWMQMKVDPRHADRPVEAFAGGIAGVEEDEDGNIQVDPTKAFLGIAAAGILGKGFIKKGRTQSRSGDGQGDIVNRRDQRTPQPETKVPTVGQTKYPMTSAKAVDALATGYKEATGKTIDEVSEIPLFDPQPEKQGLYSRFREGMNRAWVNTVEFVQDDMKRVRDLVNDPNVKVTDDTDPYLAEVLFHGRVGARLEKTRDLVISIDKDILDTAKQNGVPDQDMMLVVNKYLHARHTPERNAKLGDGAAGLTDAEAQSILEQIDALPYASEAKRIAERVQDLNNQTLEVLRENQVIDQDTYDLLRDTYKNHVPLQRILDDEEDVVEILSSRGFDVRGTGVKRAKGSERQVADIVANVVTNYEQAVIRAEKNRVDLTTLQFARDNKDLGIFEEVKPQAIGRLFSGKEGKRPPSDILETSEDFMQEVNFAEQELGRAEFEVVTEMTELSQAGERFVNDAGDVVSVPSTFPKWVPEHLRSTDTFTKVVKHLEEGTQPADNATRQKELLGVVNEEIARRIDPGVFDEQALEVIAKQKGNKASIAKAISDRAEGPLVFKQITDPRVLTLRENGKPVHLRIKDANMAMALKGVSRHQVPPMMRFIQAFTRLYSGLQTRFNPEFAFPNKIRDLQEAVVFASSRKELGIKGGVRSALNQQSYKDVYDFIRGTDSDGAKLYKQMIEDGGTTGGISLSTRESIELDIANIRKTNRSKPRQVAEKLIRTIDDFNQIVEDSTRLSIYRTALDRGVSRKRAAELAKESTVNFNKFGRGGPIMNALWMFSNASVQGTTKMLRAMRDPKTAAIVTTAVTTAVYSTGEWNDTVDPDWRTKVPEWDKLNNLVVVLPSAEEEFNYVVVPVGWGIKPIKVMADYAYDASQGVETTAFDAFNGIGAATINAYNPLGGTDIFSSVMPTILDLPAEVARNKAWHGGKIKPDWDANAPESIKYFSSLKDTSTGESAIAISKGLSGLGIEVSPADIYYAYQGYIGGAGRTATDAVNTIAAFTKFEMPEAKDVPVAGRFYKKRDNEEIGAGSDEVEGIKRILEEQSRDRFYLKQDAEDAYLQIMDLPEDQRADRFDQISSRDPELARKINDIMDEEAKGLTYTQRLITQLGVQNGERAKFIKEKLDNLESDELRADLWDEYTEKKIISKTVAEQLSQLYENGIISE